MKRCLILFSLLVPTLLSAPSAADIVPPGMRGVKYSFNISNLKDYPDHVFIVYPTTNHGCGYVYQENKGVTRLLMRKSWKSTGSRLHAMKRAEFARRNPNPKTYDHGDNGDALVLVTTPPGPPHSLPSSILIEPPPMVPQKSPVAAVHKIFHIKRLTDKEFELELEQTTTTMKDGRKEIKKFLATAEARPPARPASSTMSPEPMAPAAAPSMETEPVKPAQSDPSPRKKKHGCASCTMLAEDGAVRGRRVALLLLLVTLLFAGTRRKRRAG